MKRFFLSILLTTISTPAFACSCIPWEGGLVSEFVSKYTSFWGVPVQSGLKAPVATDWPGILVSYEIEVLESYSRLPGKNVEVRSSIEDGGSCGIQLTMGVPQFLSVRDLGNEQFRISSCTPNIPYKAIKNYLENGVDANVPADHQCFDEKNEINLENTDCAIWEGFDPWGRQGREDYLDFLVSWREGKEKDLTPR